MATSTIMKSTANVDRTTANITISCTENFNALVRAGNVANLSLDLRDITDTNLNQVIGTVPVGYRPIQSVMFYALVLINGAWSAVIGNINAAGNISFSWGSAQPTRAYITATYVI